LRCDFENVTDTGYNTTLTSGGRSVRTVEHLLSALHAFGITNLLIKTDDEVPALDGFRTRVLQADWRCGRYRAGRDRRNRSQSNTKS